MSLLKDKVTPKFESKLYNYKQNINVQQYKIINYYFVSLLIYY